MLKVPERSSVPMVERTNAKGNEGDFGPSAGLDGKQGPDISIIIVGWNSKEYLLECLRSVTREITALTIEIIVVDNSSVDGSVEAVREEFSNVNLQASKENLGFAKANNLGISLSQGRYLCLMNPDIKVLPGCIDRMFSYMETHPSVGLLGPQILNSDLSLQISWRELPSLWNSLCRSLALDKAFRLLKRRKELPPDTASPVEVLSGCLWMVRREAVQKVGLLDETFFVYAEDIDWCKRFREKRWNVVYFPESQAIHHGGTSSAWAPIESFIQMQKANLQYWRKYHGLALQIGFYVVLFLHHALRIVGNSFLYILNLPGRRDVVHKIQRSWACLRWMTAGRLTSRSGLYSSDKLFHIEDNDR